MNPIYLNLSPEDNEWYYMLKLPWSEDSKVLCKSSESYETAVSLAMTQTVNVFLTTTRAEPGSEESMRAVAGPESGEALSLDGP